MSKNDGKYFESKSHGIISRLNPDKSVMENVHIVGKLSERSRQLDVVMRAPQEYDFIAFECKDKKASIDIPVVEGYNTKLQDVGAKHGAIVSNSPFTAGAKTMAGKLGIDLLNLVDTEDPAIKTRLVAPTVLVRERVKNWGYHSDEVLPSALNNTDIRSLDFVIGRPQKSNASIKEVANELWTEIANEHEDFTGTIVCEVDSYAKIDGKMTDLPIIKFTFNIEYLRSLGELDITQTEGLYNVQEGSYQTTSITQGPFSEGSVKGWKPITFAEQNKLNLSTILTRRSDLRLSH